MKMIRSFVEKNKSLTSVLSILIALLLIYFISPFRFCFVPSGSMEPNIPTWSFCVIKIRVPYEDIQLGDIVVYNRKSDGLRIIHRVIEITDDALVTKGDANSIDDGPSVTPDNLYGKYLLHIPGIGKPLAMMKTPAGIAVTAVIIIGLFLWLMADDKRARKENADQKEQENQEGQQ